MPEERYTGFGYTKLAICTSCYTPNHIFVDSEDKREMCVRCHQLYAASHLVLGFPNAETHPILGSEVDRCQACELPALQDSFTWELTTAFLNDGTEVRVHSGCSANRCDECTTVYATIEKRHWRPEYVIPHSQFNTYTTIEGNEHCEACTITFWENNSESEYFECDHCRSHEHYNNSGWFNSTRYCQSCIDQYVYTCGNCDQERWDDDDHDCEDSDDDDSLIHSYSYRPSPFFFGTGKYHFGFELEVESRGNGRYDGAQIVQNRLGGHAYLKEDGSLSDGFEIVTHPHTLESYRTDFDWGVLETLKRQGYRSWNTRTCGLHVHVSRTAFGNGDPWSVRVRNSERSQLILARQAHELRFMKLIYDNQRQVERISGRSDNNYATFQDKGNLVRKIKQGYQSSGRYSAINTENDNTIEVRVFKGSLRRERVLSALEFVHASVEYTRDMKVTSKNHALSWLKFTGYVAANAELYPNLVTIMGESFANDLIADADDN